MIPICIIDIPHQEMHQDFEGFGHVHSMETRDCHVGSVNETLRTVGIHESDKRDRYGSSNIHAVPRISINRNRPVRDTRIPIRRTEDPKPQIREGLIYLSGRNPLPSHTTQSHQPAREFRLGPIPKQRTMGRTHPVHSRARERQRRHSGRRCRGPLVPSGVGKRGKIPFRLGGDDALERVADLEFLEHGPEAGGWRS